MTTQTYAQLQKQIEALEAQAAKLKSEETAGVVARIKEAITTYALTPQDLFGGKQGTAKTKTKAAAKKSMAAKYVDGKGGQWVGRGKRPRWLSEALAAGKKLEDFAAGAFKSAVEAVTPAPAPETAAPKKRGPRAKAAKAAKPAKKNKQRAASVAKYSDGAGKSWTGMGPKPKWFKDALAGGKKPEDLLAPAA